MSEPIYPPSAEKVAAILTKLAELFPDAQCELNFATPFQLLIATILSAQCTDKKVNKVTARLFAAYPEPQDYLALGQAGLEHEIHELGLFHHKAQNIIATCRELIDRFAGQVPNDIDLLQTLPGVGRKTANVVISNAFGVPALAVDTHVFRVSNRLGLAQGTNVGIVEKQLESVIPREKWIKTHHRLIFLGRRICSARKPKCAECPLRPDCSQIF